MKPDLSRHPFIQSQYNEVYSAINANNIDGAAKNLRSIATQICKFYLIKNFAKYKDCSLNSKIFPNPTPMINMIDGAGLIEQKYADLLIDMIQEGNRAVHPEGGQKPSERNVRNDVRDLDALLCYVIRAFPSEKIQNTANAEPPKNFSKKTVKQVVSSDEKKQNNTIFNKIDSNRLKGHSSQYDHFIKVKSIDNNSKNVNGYTVDGFHFSGDFSNLNKYKEIFIDWDNHNFVISSSFRALCERIVDIMKEDKTKKYYILSTADKRLNFTDQGYEAIKAFFGVKKAPEMPLRITKEEYVALCLIFAKRFFYDPSHPEYSQSVFNSVRKRIYLNDPCPCGSGKKYKDCCFPSNPYDI